MSNEQTVGRYAHMCRMDHEQIGHNDSEHEQCPLCRAQDERDALSTELAEAKRENAALRNLADNLQPGTISEALVGARYETESRLRSELAEAKAEIERMREALRVAERIAKNWSIHWWHAGNRMMGEQADKDHSQIVAALIPAKGKEEKRDA